MRTCVCSCVGQCVTLIRMCVFVVLIGKFAFDYCSVGGNGLQLQ